MLSVNSSFLPPQSVMPFISLPLLHKLDTPPPNCTPAGVVRGPHPHLVLSIREKSFSFIMMLAIASFIRLRKFSSSLSLLNIFYHEGVLNFVNFFLRRFHSHFIGKARYTCPKVAEYQLLASGSSCGPRLSP